MVKLLFFLFSLLLVMSARGQNISSHHDPDALYPSLDDLLDHRPDTSCHLRKVDDVRVDSIIHRCWFTDRDKGMIKNVIAVSYSGQLYFQDQFVRQQLPCTFHPHARKESNCFYPILERGRYYFFEMLSEDKDPDLSIAMGLMSGVVGSAFGNSLTPPEMFRSSIILDAGTKTFFGLDTWKDMETFLNTNFPDQHVELKSGLLYPDDVKKLIKSLNKN